MALTRPFQDLPLYFTDINFDAIPAREAPLLWRVKERMKTMNMGLCMCLNIGVDPPDVVKPPVCARQECWVDPMKHNPQKAMTMILKNIELQYQRWQPKARYKVLPDPTVEDVKKMCHSLRRAAKDERILFHYTGHGVPRPTPNGEIWVFNKTFTQYIPLSLFELQQWNGAPAIYVFDCSAAGLVVQSFLQFADQHDAQPDPQLNGAKFRDSILLAATGSNEMLPMSPHLPADVFSSCLTTPIKMSLVWYLKQTPLLQDVTVDQLDEIPGSHTERRTPMGELNWIFTAITDTIAWNTLPIELFHKLFRQDLVVAALFRNFLLADRIMRTMGCTPISHPKLEPTFRHTLWDAWDLAMENCLTQLRYMENGDIPNYRHSTFFADQLSAFELWLKFGDEHKRPPLQLPIVLQVLLSQDYRSQALHLLARFLDMGPWAVGLALAVGIFPYVLKLLQSPAQDLKSVLLFIWAKIMAVERNCQVELLKENGHGYFLTTLANPSVPSSQVHMSLFVLSIVCDRYYQGQHLCLQNNLLALAANNLEHPDPQCRKWACFAMAKLWQDCNEVKKYAVQMATPQRLVPVLSDDVPEVRAAAVYAIGTFFGFHSSEATTQVDASSQEMQRKCEYNLAQSLLRVHEDASVMVRREFTIALAHLVVENQDDFRRSASRFFQENKGSVENAEGVAMVHSLQGVRQMDFLFTAMFQLTNDPSPHVSDLALVILRMFPPPEMAQTPHPVSGTPQIPRRSQSPFNSRASQIRRTSSGTSLSSQQASTAAHSIASNVADSGSETPSRATTPVRPSRQATPSTAMPAVSVEGPSVGGYVTHEMIPVSLVFEQAVQFYVNPIMPQVPDYGSPDEQARTRRKKRIATLAAITEPQQSKAPNNKQYDQFAILESEKDSTSSVQFHSIDPYLIVCDSTDGISVWNWEDDSSGPVRFRNNNATGIRVTTTCLVNETSDDSLLLAGSNNGVVKLWRDWQRAPQQVTSWRALDITPDEGPGLVTSWQQARGRLFVSGHTGVIKMWDCEKELCVQNLPTHSEHVLTCLSSDPNGSNTLIAGCGDGEIKLFDSRIPPHMGLVMGYKEHEQYVINAQMRDECNFISGSLGGEIKFWDTRVTQSLTTIQAHRSQMTCMALHPRAAIIASGSQNQYIKVFNFAGECLVTIKYHDGWLGQRIGPVSCLAFHPYHMLLAAGYADPMVSIYAADKPRHV